MIHKQKGKEICYQFINHFESVKVEELMAVHKVVDVAVISKNDYFNPHMINKELGFIYSNENHNDLIFLVPHKSLPLYSYRQDGEVKSFIASVNVFNSFKGNCDFKRLSTLIYHIAYKYLNSTSSNNIDIIQIGKPQKDYLQKQENLDKLSDALMVIPQKGSLKLLERCLFHLNLADNFPGEINVCFDDLGYKSFNKDSHPNLVNRLSVYKNSSNHVGPYLCRHYSILNTEKKYIFFQDADDVSVRSRFLKQVEELSVRKLDMIGSHELRIDQLKRKILVIRFPADANRSLEAHQFHSMFHPTSLITKKAYLKTGGFSTDRRFGYDSQFLLRAHFHLKIGNMDDFLYIRFKRSNSLTTHPDTRIGSNLRTFLLWRWNVDFKLICENKLDLDESSLSVQKHVFNYKLIKV